MWYSLKFEFLFSGLKVIFTSFHVHRLFTVLIFMLVNMSFYPAISTFAVQICYANKFLLYSYQTNTFLYYTNKLFSLRINFLVPCIYVTAEGAEEYETGTNVARTTKMTAVTTVMKGEEWRLFLFFLFKSDKFSDFFWHCRINTIYVYCR